VTGVSLLLKHGLMKVLHFSSMASHSLDPIHLGVVPSLIFALISDFVCSLLIIVGLVTRLAAIIMFVNISVARAFVEHFAFFGRNGDRGELIALYLGAMVAIFQAGPGRYSIDHLPPKRQRVRHVVASDPVQHHAFAPWTRIRGLGRSLFAV
jgi:putative oxidoreductase